jgi:hypothetical protein
MQLSMNIKVVSNLPMTEQAVNFKLLSKLASLTESQPAHFFTSLI